MTPFYARVRYEGYRVLVIAIVAGSNEPQAVVISEVGNVDYVAVNLMYVDFADGPWRPVDWPMWPLDKVPA